MKEELIYKMLTAYEKQNLKEFQNLLKENIKAFDNVHNNPGDELIKFCEKLIDEDAYEYLKEFEIIFDEFQYHVLSYKANKLIQEKYVVLENLQKNELSKLDYPVKKNLEEYIDSLCFYIYHAHFFSVQENDGKRQPYMIMTKQDMEMALDNIFFQFDLMIDLLEGAQKYSKKFRGNFIENRVSYPFYKRIAHLTKAAELYFPDAGFNETKICNIVDKDSGKIKIDSDSFNNWKNLTDENSNKFYEWVESASQGELESARKKLSSNNSKN